MQFTILPIRLHNLTHIFQILKFSMLGYKIFNKKKNTQMLKSHKKIF